MKRKSLYIGPLLRIIAGFVVTVGATLTYYHSIYWLILVLFVSLNLFQSGFTSFCMMEKILLALGFPGELQELSKKTRYLKKVMESKQKAIEASRAKSEFLAKMSHEIRTPMNGIIGMVELAMETELNSGQKGLLESINFEADSLLNLINDILDFSKIEAGKIELEIAPFDLYSMVNSLGKCAAVKARQKTLDLFVYIDPKVPSHVVGDTGRLRQILINLIGNAIKFTSKGDVSLIATLSQEEEESMTLRFEVKDTGIGIPKEKQSLVFESFAQANSSITRKYGGTGLGITICKQLVELMNGEIGLESEKDKGSTFWFTVQLSRDPAASEEAALDLKGVNILMVDEHPMQGFILTNYIQALGGNVDVCRSEAEALEKIKGSDLLEKPMKLVVADYGMLQKNQFDFIKKIRAEYGIKDLPVLVLSSSEVIKDKALLQKVGIQKVLIKPVDIKTLARNIDSVLRQEAGDLLEEGDSSCSGRSDSDPLVYKALYILLVEDYPTNQQVAIRHLERAGHTVNLAENGLEAVDLFRKNNYDLVLMDVQMPWMDGFDATREIREIEAISGAERTPIIAMTAFAIAGFQEKCLDKGMDDYITKPLRRITLLDIVSKWSEESCRGPQAGEGKKGVCNESFRAPITNHMEGNKISPPLFFDKALAEFEGDEEFLMEVVEDFLDISKVQIRKIRKAIDKSKPDLVAAEAHSIKGAASNLAALELTDAAKRLEEIGMSGNLDQGLEVLSLLEEERNRLDVYYRELTA